LRIALTFDAEHHDRPSDPRATEEVLDALGSTHVPATFFLQGRWAQAHPRTARRIADEGHLVGNHSHYHTPLTLLSPAGLLEDVITAERAIERATGVDTRPWFRCPYGEGADDPQITARLRALGYRHVHWDIDPYDWEPSLSSRYVERTVVEGALAVGDGAIALLHPWTPSGLAALPGITRLLRDAGARFVRIDELRSDPRGGAVASRPG
jgi:peptidoglycan/xylan/chitin deacetylase (PgdA/CDA1 family)